MVLQGGTPPTPPPTMEHCIRVISGHLCARNTDDVKCISIYPKVYVKTPEAHTGFFNRGGASNMGEPAS